MNACALPVHCLCAASHSLRPLSCLSCSFAGQKTTEGLDLKNLVCEIFGSDDDDEFDDTPPPVESPQWYRRQWPPGLGQPQPLRIARHLPSGISDEDRPRVVAAAKARLADPGGWGGGPWTYAIANGLPPPESLPRYLKPPNGKQGLFYGPLAWKPPDSQQ